MSGEWKCVLRDDPTSLNVLLIIYRVVGKEIEFLHPGENGQPMLSIQSPFQPSKPFMVLSGTMAKEVLNGLSDALDNAGIKSDSNAKIEGTLVATKEHLKDLRKLLKLDRK